ncbi:MAG: hypothetical protein M3Y53_05755 [Thermoproteota archaeon]|nr:hypothetical protein [Thermoproteota archaeon]
MISMSTKRESERAATTFSEDDKTREIRTALTEQHHSVEKALDETKDNVKRTIEEARKDMPRSTSNQWLSRALFPGN